MRSAIRRVSAIGRLAVAIALLVALSVGILQVVDESSGTGDTRREQDWGRAVQAISHPVKAWLDAGAQEAQDLAGHLAGNTGRAQAGIDTFLERPLTFTRSALLVGRDGRSVSAASRDLAVLTGRRPAPCVQDGVTDDTLASLAASAPAVSGFFLVPGECRSLHLAFAAPFGGQVAVVLARPADGLALVSVEAFTSGKDRDGSARLFIVDPRGSAARPGEVSTAPPRITSFLDGGARTEARVGRYSLGEGNVQILGASAPLREGWVLVIEQDAAAFDLSPEERPTPFVAMALVGAFAIVILLLAAFDVRRQRAHRRAEVAKNSFFSTASHELRTPLTTLKGFTETLAARWDDVDDDRRRALVERMLPQSRRLDRLVDRLLTGASMQAQTHTHPQTRAMDVVPVVEQVVDGFRAEAPLHMFVVETAGEAEALADPKALEQSLGQVVDNAVKYSPSGGTVRVAVQQSRRGVEIVVDDDGVGLPSDIRRLFEPLTQGESVTKRVHDEGGMGMGLFIARTLVVEMGGSIDAQRRQPHGARLTLTLKASRSSTNRRARIGQGVPN